MNEMADALRFYRDLGFEEIYVRRSEVATAAAPAPTPVVAVAPKQERPVVITPAAPAPLFTPSSETLEQVRADLGECTRCKLHSTRHSIVFGSGNPKAEVVFVGEGPGADEDAQGLPFVGRAGQLLTQMIEGTARKEGIPLTRPDVYICNVVKCRPPENRTPQPDEMEICGQFLFRQLLTIKPKAICALGSTA